MECFYVFISYILVMLAQFSAILLLLWAPVSARILALVLQLCERNKLKLKPASVYWLEYFPASHVHFWQRASAIYRRHLDRLPRTFGEGSTSIFCCFKISKCACRHCRFRVSLLKNKHRRQSNCRGCYTGT